MGRRGEARPGQARPRPADADTRGLGQRAACHQVIISKGVSWLILDEICN